MENDLVCATPPWGGISIPQVCTYFGAYLKNYSYNFPETLGHCSKQYKGNLPYKGNLTYHLQGGYPLNANVFHLVHIFNPKTGNTITLSEWWFVWNSQTAFVWYIIICWNTMQYCKIFLEYIAYNIPTSNLKSFEHSKDITLFVSCNVLIGTEQFL